MKNAILNMIKPSKKGDGDILPLPSNANNSVVPLQKTQYNAGPDTEAKNEGFKISNKGIFGIVVLLPTLITAIYMLLFAVDQYKSEAMFVVKSTQKGPSIGLGAILEQSGLTGSSSDTYSVISFIESRDALRQLQEKIDFQSMMSRDGADFIARFPGYSFSSSFESLYDHYKRKVNVALDPTTNISSLSVKAFTAEDAEQIARTILSISDVFITKLNDQALRDALQLAEQGVKRAENRVLQANDELEKLRGQRSTIDPRIEVERLSEIASGLAEKRLTLLTRIVAMEENAPNSPQLSTLRQELRIIEQQIQDNQTVATGTQNNETNITDNLTDFGRLKLETEFAEKALASALTSFEVARNDALRKQVYIATVVEPNASDEAGYPKRIQNIAVVFAIFFGLFIIVWLLFANLREHAE